MPKRKINRVKMNQLLKSGKSGKEIAQYFGVSEGAISKAKKELNVAVVKDVALRDAHRVVDSHLDTLGQMRKINNYANELLDLLMRWNRGDQEALQILESQVKKIRIGKTEKCVEEYKFKDPRELSVKIMGEIRGQLALQNDIMKTFYDVQQTAEFQEVVLETLGEARCPVCGAQGELREDALRRLHKKQALHSSVQVRP